MKAGLRRATNSPLENDPPANRNDLPLYEAMSVATEIVDCRGGSPFGSDGDTPSPFVNPAGLVALRIPDLPPAASDHSIWINARPLFAFIGITN
jgi:hypothetical protein